MHNRIDKINELIREQISEAIYRFDSDNFTSISSVNTSKDLSYCDISILVLGDDNQIVELLNQNSGKLQARIASKLSFRKMPKIRFHLDKSESEAEKIDKLLEKV